MWSISGKLLHTDTYVAKYSDMLAHIIGASSVSILDTACGTGFPALNLIEKGFCNISCSDADEDLLDEFRQRMSASAVDLTLMRCGWQTLSQSIKNQYDVVLCVDAAIGFMDSWMDGEMRSGPARILDRVTEVLRQFVSVTANGGRFIIGLQKNNSRSNVYYSMLVGSFPVEGIEAEAWWNMSYDWEARVKTWENVVTWKGQRFTQTKQSYLFDKAELAELLLKAGFSSVREAPTPADIYEDILIATR
jgi:SAM-dependent methyltransferase